MSEFAIMEWFPPPTYPDRDPLLVNIDLKDPHTTNCETFIHIECVDPTPVTYEV